MIRYFALVICLGLLAGSASIAAEPVVQDQPSTAGPACLYDDKSFSDGAIICVQKSVMLSCSTEGPHPIWKMVADRDLSERCTAPTASNYSKRHRRHARRAHWIRRGRTETPKTTSSKCFYFNNKQYCE
jgi:hypothetical protein